MAAGDIIGLVFAACLTGLLIVFRKKLQELIELLDNWRGGPPGPMHPLPSADAHLLCKRSPKPSVPR
jgi:hypothetical protein